MISITDPTPTPRLGFQHLNVRQCDTVSDKSSHIIEPFRVFVEGVKKRVLVCRAAHICTDVTGVRLDQQVCSCLPAALCLSQLGGEPVAGSSDPDQLKRALPYGGAASISVLFGQQSSVDSIQTMEEHSYS